MKTLPALAALLMTGCLSVTTHASTSMTNVRQQAVSYADLDLSRESDVATLLRRIKVAAHAVCADDRMPVQPLAFLYQTQVCAREAMARAIADVGAPLTARQADTGRAIPSEDARLVVLVRTIN